MSIYDAIKEEEELLKQQMGEAEMPKQEEHEETEVAPEEEAAPADETESAGHEATETAKGDEALTPTDFYRMRQKNKILEQRLDDISRAQPTQQAVEQSSVGFNKPEPDKMENYEGWLEWRNEKLEYQLSNLEGKFEQVAQKIEQEEAANRQRQLYEGAAKEIAQFENEYKKVVTDYDSVTQNAYNNLLTAYQTIGFGREEAAAKIAQQVLDISAAAYRKGINPAEAIYDFCLERFGRPQAQAKPDVEAPKPSNLKKIEETKRRSVSGIAAGGQTSSPQITIESAAEMSLGEFAKLDASTLRRLEGR